MPENLKSLGHHKIPQATIDKIIHLHETQGLDHLVLAERFNKARSTIKNILDRHNEGKNGKGKSAVSGNAQDKAQHKKESAKGLKPRRAASPEERPASS